MLRFIAISQHDFTVKHRSYFVGIIVVRFRTIRSKVDSSAKSSKLDMQATVSYFKSYILVFCLAIQYLPFLEIPQTEQSAFLHKE